MGRDRELSEFSKIDRTVSAAHRLLFVRFRVPSLALAVAVYAAGILLSGDALAVSANYYVLIPAIAAAITFGFWGGLVAGALGLPGNLLLFAILGHPEYSPASKVIAELSGIILGASLGYLSDLYGKLQAEIARRMRTEASLMLALEDKDILLQEVNHRVRNNLNVIKSLIGLQSSRSGDPAFISASRQLQQRVFAIALVQEQLYGKDGLSRLRPSEYLPQLVANLVKGHGSDASVAFDIRDEDESLSLDQATPLGLIVSEVITNSLKYAFDGVARPEIRVAFRREGGSWLLSLGDNGPGFAYPRGQGSGLGLKLVETLCRQVGGTCRFAKEGGAFSAWSCPRRSRAPAAAARARRRRTGTARLSRSPSSKAAVL
jgi:two-component sensor histidine kinase